MKEHYLSVLKQGCTIEYKKLSICPIKHYYVGPLKYAWQVDCEHPKEKYSEFFDNLETAVDVFMELKESVYS